MKSIINILYVVLVLFNTACAQQNKLKRNDTLKMNIKEFKIKVENRINFILSNDTMKLEDAVDMVRIYNTISHNVSLLKEDNNSKYVKLFFGKHSEEASHLLKALPTKGMAYYSKDYDLYIGGPPHTNSKYEIVEE